MRDGSKAGCGFNENWNHLRLPRSFLMLVEVAHTSDCFLDTPRGCSGHLMPGDINALGKLIRNGRSGRESGMGQNDGNAGGRCPLLLQNIVLLHS